MLIRHERPETTPSGIRFWTNSKNQTVMDDWFTGIRTTWIAESTLVPILADKSPRVVYEPHVNIHIKQEELW